MRKLAMAILLVAMLAIGLAGVAGAADKCDPSKDGCGEDCARAHKGSNKIKRVKKHKADQTTEQVAPATTK
jgi:hypothetical protein